MKTLAYILVICLVIVAGCGGCGSTSSSMSESNPTQIENDSISQNYKIMTDQLNKENELDRLRVEEERKKAFRHPANTTSEGTSQGERENYSLIEEMPIASTPPPQQPMIQSANGTLVYKVDSVLTIGVVSRVEARIIKKVSQMTTEQLVEMTTHTSTGIIRTEVIKVGDIIDMELVTLEPDVFTITEITDGEQPIDESTVTEWLWGVTAQKMGNYNLILKAKVKGVSRDKIVFDKQISVKNKPKKFYNMTLDIPENLVKYVENDINLTTKERQGDTYFFEWGGDGKVLLEFKGLNPGETVTITRDADYDYIISDNKSLFNYKWVIRPEELSIERDSLHYVVKIIGDYEEVVIIDRVVKMDRNLKGWLNEFLNTAAEKWYWLFSTLIIPLYLWIKKKYFPEKKIFRRRRKKPTPKPKTN